MQKALVNLFFSYLSGFIVKSRPLNTVWARVLNPSDAASTDDPGVRRQEIHDSMKFSRRTPLNA
jgi:hypothetical protein